MAIESIESRRKYNERLKRLDKPLVLWVEWLKFAIIAVVFMVTCYIFFTAVFNLVDERKRLRDTPPTPNGPCLNEQCN